MAKRVLLSLITSVFLCYPHFRAYLASDNRVVHHWNHTDGLLHGLVGLSLAALLWTSYECLRRTRWRSAARIAFVILFGFAFAQTVLLQTSLSEEASFWPSGLFALSLGAIALWIPRARIPGRVATLGLILSPLCLILLYQFASFSSYDFPPESIHFPQPPVERTPVVILIFDEWSYPRTFPGGKLRPELQRLGELTRHSCSFHQANSAGERTLTSVPGFLYQTVDRLTINPHGAFFSNPMAGNAPPCAKASSHRPASTSTTPLKSAFT